METHLDVQIELALWQLVQLVCLDCIVLKSDLVRMTGLFICGSLYQGCLNVGLVTESGGKVAVNDCSGNVAPFTNGHIEGHGRSKCFGEHTVEVGRIPSSVGGDPEMTGV